jgi:hypothetical protein
MYSILYILRVDGGDVSIMVTDSQRPWTGSRYSTLLPAFTSIVMTTSYEKGTVSNSSLQISHLNSIIRYHICLTSE